MWKEWNSKTGITKKLTLDWGVDKKVKEIAFVVYTLFFPQFVWVKLCVFPNWKAEVKYKLLSNYKIKTVNGCSIQQIGMYFI